jgi:hypothetical protein
MFCRLKQTNNDIENIHGRSVFLDEHKRALKMIRRRFSIDQRLEAAKKRRDEYIRQRVNLMCSGNLRQSSISKSALQKRWRNDTILEKSSFLARKQSEEQVLLSHVC